jgi:antitoxin (DNA-binding transcriptional repressor) of toxin-antitoxin stability system
MLSATVNMLEAKSNLSRLVHDLEAGAVDQIVIARNGRPAARLVPLDAPPATDRRRRIGVARGRFDVPALPAGPDDEIVRLFEAGGAGG